MKVILILVVTFNIILVSGQFKTPIHRFGNVRSTARPTTNAFVEYRPTIPRNKIDFSNNGQYRGGEDGQYRPQVYNRNSFDEGKYVPDDSGKYVHVSIPYDGGYGDNGNRGGYYNDDIQKYKHQNGRNGADTAYKKEIFKNPGFSKNLKPITFTSAATVPTKKIIATPKSVIYGESTANRDPGFQHSASSRFRTYGNEGGWRILRLDKDIDPKSYSYSYETENKIIGEEAGYLINPGGKDETVKTSGFYEYEGDDGKTYRVEYTADENGFVPKGSHIPEGIEQAVQFLTKTTKN